MHALLQDLRFAARQLRKNPGLTALLVLTVALGIGANTAMFSVVNGFVRPLPVRAPDQIVVLAAQLRSDKLAGLLYRVSYPALMDFREQADSFSDVFGYTVNLAGLSSGGKATSILYSIVTGNYFSALGVKPVTGRLFLPGEGERPGKELGVVLGYSYWQKRFGGDPGVIGKVVRVDGKPATVVGIVPREFRGLYAGAEMDAYLPLNQFTFETSPDALFTDRNLRQLTLMGRLKPGVSLAQAQSAVDVIARRLAERYPATDKEITVRVVPERLARPMPLPAVAQAIPLIGGLFLVLAAVVLLVACMNVANLQMVQATLRRREMAIRAALGSGRARLVRQMLTESILVAMLGGIGGVFLGVWVSDAISSVEWLQTSLPTRLDFSFDWRVFAYALVASVLTGVLVGVWPALRASRTNVNAVLHDGGHGDSGGAGRQRVRGVLVVAQVGGSLMLLIAAGLFVRSLQRAQRVELGFDPNHVLNVAMDPHQVGYDQSRTRDFYRELENRVRALPGVQSASLAFSVPMGYWNDGSYVYVEGRPVTPGQPPPLVLSNQVDAGYFGTMRIPILRGRAFRESDNETAPLVAIVNETMAQQFWPNQDPIGKRFRIHGAGKPWRQVVGVARNGKYLVVFEHAMPYFYMPVSQAYVSLRVLQVRSTVPPESLSARVQREVQALDPEMPVIDVRTMRQSLAGLMGFMMFQFGASVAGAMGMLGLTLAMVGVYGVISYAASQRTREIGIRMALGAHPRDVLGLVLRQGVGLVLAGVIAGLIAALLIARVIARFLFVSPTDPLAFVGVTLLLAAIGLWACYVPARCAMRVDPIEALRHE